MGTASCVKVFPNEAMSEQWAPPRYGSGWAPLWPTGVALNDVLPAGLTTSMCGSVWTSPCYCCGWLAHCHLSNPICIFPNPWPSCCTPSMTPAAIARFTPTRKDYKNLYCISQPGPWKGFRLYVKADKLEKNHLRAQSVDFYQSIGYTSWWMMIFIIHWRKENNIDYNFKA